MEQFDQVREAHARLQSQTQHEELVAKINAMSEQLEVIFAFVQKQGSKKAAKSEE